MHNPLIIPKKGRADDDAEFERLFEPSPAAIDAGTDGEEKAFEREVAANLPTFSVIKPEKGSKPVRAMQYFLKFADGYACQKDKITAFQELPDEARQIMRHLTDAFNKKVKKVNQKVKEP